MLPHSLPCVLAVLGFSGMHVSHIAKDIKQEVLSRHIATHIDLRRNRD